MKYWNVDTNTKPDQYSKCPDKCGNNCTVCNNCAHRIILLTDGKYIDFMEL